MAEYIERELLIDTIHHRVRQLVCFVPDNEVGILTPNSNTMRVVGLRDLLGHVKSIPTADVVEVRHGKWRKSGNEKACSRCTFIYYSNNDEWNYCPTCGAKMDGKGEGE